MIKVYDPLKFSTIINSTAVKGYAEGTYVEIAHEGSRYSEVYDSRGTEMVRIKQADKGARVTITLTQASQSNDMFSVLREADRISNAGVFNIFIKDGNGTSVFTGLDCFIPEPPTAAFGNEGVNRVWVIRVPVVQHFIGGY